MKMNNEDYNRIVKVFENHTPTVIEHYNDIKAAGNYKVLEVRVAWDLLRAFLGTKWICEQYDKGLNDTHITTASVKALKEILKYS